MANYGTQTTPHYAYFDAQGNPIALEENQRELTGTVTVGECKHEGVKATPNNDGTHSLKCPYCGYNKAAEPCSYEFSGDVGTCTCGDKLTVRVDPAPLTYDGTEKKPGVTVKRGDVELATSAYTVSYADNKDAGDATVRVSIGTNQGTYSTKDVFLSIFNPLYFIEELGDDGKKLLERYLPDVPRESVMPLLNDATRTLLEEQEFFSPESFLKKQREEIRELEQDVVYLTGQKDLAESQKLDAAERVTSLTDRLDTLTAERDALVDKRFQGIDIEEAQEQLVELSARYEEMAKGAPEGADTAAIDDELQKLQRKLGERSAEQYAPKYAGPIAEFSAKVTELGQKYRREAGLLKGFRAGIACPMCRRNVTEAELPSIKLELQKNVDAIVAEGKNTTAKLDELRALEKKSEDTFLRFREEDTARYHGEIEELTRKRTEAIEAAAVQNAQRQKDMDELLAQIRYLSAIVECGSLTFPESERLKVCEMKLESCKAELSAAQLIADRSPDDFGEKISAKQEQIEEKKKLLSAMALYVSKRAELLFSCLKMNRVEISLFDVVKSTGEVKDTLRAGDGLDDPT